MSEDPENPDPVYAGIDACTDCGALRAMVDETTVYKPSHWGYNTLTEPECKKKGTKFFGEKT